MAVRGRGGTFGIKISAAGKDAAQISMEAMQIRFGTKKARGEGLADATIPHI
jgi:hypothetical protein